jgi:hypothetical protein
VIRAIREYVADDSAWDRLNEVLREHRAMTVAEGLLRELPASGLAANAVLGLAVRLATTATHSEPVKHGLILFGLTGAGADRELVHVLGENDEFTQCAVVALLLLCGDAEPDLWRLGKRVHGWGRIHVVDRLWTTQRADIKRWLLVEGFRNTITDEYLACTAAVAGGLADALADDPDDELVSAACDLIDTL